MEKIDKIKFDLIYKYLIENSYIIFFILNKNGKIIKANNFAFKLLGDNIISKEFKDILVEFKKNNFNLSEIIEKNKNPVILDIKTIFNIPESFYFYFFSSKNEILVLGEENFFELNNLKINYIKLNSELANISRELYKKNAELQKINDFKNEILGIAAHDLRNPISQIKMCSDFLLKEIGNDIKAEYNDLLSIIDKIADFMLNLLNDILDFAAIESGIVKLNKEKVNIIEIIKNNIYLNSLIAKNKNIEIIFNYTDEKIEIEIDFKKIFEVLNNLISNAIKFSKENTKITVSIKKEKSKIIVSIQDEGPGILEKEKDKIFKPFQKTSNKPTNNESSTGLGLVISKKIIEIHNGEIDFESIEGKGTTFYFTLPYS